MNIFDIISGKFSSKVTKASSTHVTEPLDCNHADTENLFLSKLSKHALKLYERQCDIKNFTKLALSDPQNTSHNDLVKDLLNDGVIDPLDDSLIEELSKNDDLLSDLDL